MILAGLLANPNNVEAMQKSLKREFQQTPETLKRAEKSEDDELSRLVSLALKYTDTLIEAEKNNPNCPITT